MVILLGMCCTARTLPLAGAPLPPCLQAALQNKRMEFRATVAEGIKGIFQRQEEGGDAATAAAAPGGAAGGQANGPAGEEAIWVHGGFLEAYASVRPVVLRLLDTVLAGEPRSAGAWRGQQRRVAGCSSAVLCGARCAVPALLPARG